MTDTSRIQTTTVGSYPVPNWLVAMPTEQGVIDATRVIFDTQRQAGIDLPTDGELYRFNPNHPETNGMIEYFVHPMGGTRSALGRSEIERFHQMQPMGFRTKPAAVVEDQLSEGSLNLISDCQRTASVAGGSFKFTLTSPYMLARTLLDDYYKDFDVLLMAIADVLAQQVQGLNCNCIQIDEANIPGNPDDGPLAAAAMNRVLDAIDADTKKAVHFCFGNYGGQNIQQGSWKKLVSFLNSLHCDHLILELAHRPKEDLVALRDIDHHIEIGIGVIDIKVNHVETPEQVAGRIQEAERILGEGRVKWIHPDCGFWMLHRSIADRKMIALVKGKDLYLG